MREPGFEEFAELWNGSETDEREAFEALARKARRQGRIYAYADAALVLSLAAGCAIGLAMKPSPVMFALAIAMMAIGTYATWKRRALRQMTLTLEANNRASFLEASIRNARANLRRMTLSLTLIPVILLAAILFKVAMRHGGRLDHPITLFSEWLVSTRGVVTMTIMTFIVGHSVRSLLRTKAELRRLEELKKSYDNEDKANS